MRDLKVATPEQLLAMRPSVLGTWAALWGISPAGEERADLRAAIVAQQTARAWLKKSSGGDWKLADFMPYQRAQSDDEAKALSARLRAALGVFGKGRQ